MTKIKSFELSVSYSTVAVFDPSAPGLDDGFFLYFRGEHEGQGFAWNPGNFNFRTFMNDEFSSAFIEVWLADEISLMPDSVRAILVPFSVGKSGIVINSDMDEEVPVPEGNYALVFEMKLRDDEEYFKSPRYQTDLETSQRSVWCRLTFIPKESVEPEILREDAGLSPDYPLLMEAEPA